VKRPARDIRPVTDDASAIAELRRVLTGEDRGMYSTSPACAAQPENLSALIERVRRLVDSHAEAVAEIDRLLAHNERRIDDAESIRMLLNCAARIAGNL